MHYRTIITLRYTLAIGLIACVLTASFVVLGNQFTQNEKYAHTLNISGMQRMLSQRIALSAREISLANTQAEAKEYTEKMRAALAKMQQNHAELYSNNPAELSDKLRFMYEGEQGVDARLNMFFHAAEQLLEDTELLNGTIAQNNPNVEALAAIARNGLLAELNAIVFAHQAEADESLISFKRAELAMYLLGMLVLVLEVLFIFRPLSKNIQQKTHALERSNKELTEFAYRLSHDLRAPVISSKGIVRIATEALEKGNDAAVRKSLEHVGNSMEKLNALVEDVLMLMEMKFNDAIAPEPIDINILYENSLANLNHLPGAENMHFATEINLSRPLYCKRIYLQQIIENLLSNAIKYADPKESQPYARFVVEQQGNKVLIRVQDNGLGIGKTEREKLFVMFRRLHPNVSFGSGLGLYLVQENAKALGGSASYHPLDKGSEFRITLPNKRAI